MTEIAYKLTTFCSTFLFQHGVEHITFSFPDSLRFVLERETWSTIELNEALNWICIELNEALNWTEHCIELSEICIELSSKQRLNGYQEKSFLSFATISFPYHTHFRSRHFEAIQISECPCGLNNRMWVLCFVLLLSWCVLFCFSPFRCCNRIKNVASSPFDNYKNKANLKLCLLYKKTACIAQSLSCRVSKGKWFRVLQVTLPNFFWSTILA